MKWVLEHLQIIIAVAAAIAYWLNQRRQAAAEDEPPASPREMSDQTEQAERTRRVQDEIRRKIAERRGGAVPPPVTATAAPRERLPKMIPPLQVPPLEPFGGPVRRRIFPAHPPVIVADEAAEKAALARQARLAEQMRVLEAERQAEHRRAQEIAERHRQEAEPVVAPAFPLGNLRDQVRDPRELRRAIVLREILGAPVGLR